MKNDLDRNTLGGWSGAGKRSEHGLLVLLALIIWMSGFGYGILSRFIIELMHRLLHC